MDTYENNDVMPKPEPEENLQPEISEELPAEHTDAVIEEQQLCQEDPSDGFYHGAGTGTRETTFISPESVQSTESPEPTQAASAFDPVPPRKPGRKKKGMGKKVLKYAAVAVLILALVAAGCGISIAVTNRYWWSYNQTLQRNFEQQIQVLRQELEEYMNNSSSSVVVPTKGMTPSQIYEKNINSVVAINCVIRTNNNGQVSDAAASGSGFVLSADGYVVTNHHVVDGATSISVNFANGRTVPALLVGSDAINDIALLKVAAENLQPVSIGSSSALRVGDQVVAIGNALGELSFSLTVGYVSGTDRNINTDGSIMNMIQTDASINSGNSGGPLFNAKGEVVGITTAKYSGATSSGALIEGVGFAIPMDDVIGMLDDLRQYGYITGAYMGVMVRDMDPTVAEMYGMPMGAYVVEATAGYAAEKAGIWARDIITNLGGYEIESMSDLTRALRNFRAGEQTTVVVWRSGQKIALNIVFDEKPHN